MTTTTRTTTAPGAVRSGGRPLDAQRDDAILAAALELVGEVGYDKMTMESIAARAQASKATIYRRWSDKAELVAAAVEVMACRASSYPDTGDFREDLLASLRMMTSTEPSSDLPIVCGVLTAALRDERLGAVLRERVAPVKRAAALAFIERAVQRGQLPADVDKELFHEIGPAMVLTRVMTTGQPMDEQFIVHVVDDVLLPLLFRTSC